MPILTHPPSFRARYVLVFWLCGLSAILYLDRICMAQAVRPIKDELHLTNIEASWVAMAFTLAYGLFAVPAGRLGDQIGPRIILTLIVLCWSAFTGLTGLATGLATLLVVRFLFGAAEAGAYPNTAKVLSRWYPIGERGRVQGFLLAAGQVGAVAAPAGAAYLIEIGGWRWAFGAFAVLGFLWAVGFWFWYRDDPADHPGVSAGELAEIRERTEHTPTLPATTTEVPTPRQEPAPQETAIRTSDGRESSAPANPGAVEEQALLPGSATDSGPIPWREVAVNRGILVLCLIMIFGAFYTYFFYSWFPTYLRDARGIDNVTAGNLASLVIAGSAVGMLFGGWLADRLPAWTSEPTRARRYLGVVSYLTAAGCLFAGIRCDDALNLALLWGASFCAMHVTLPNWWSVAIPQAGRHVGALFGLMNGAGVLGALASQGFVGLYADWQASRGLTGRAQWDPLFSVYVVVLLGGAVAWWLYRFTPLPDHTNAAATAFDR
jgi:MFS family permease